MAVVLCPHLVGFLMRCAQESEPLCPSQRDRQKDRQTPAFRWEEFGAGPFRKRVSSMGLGLHRTRRDPSDSCKLKS